MDRLLALEYSGDKKWYTYKMFESLQYDQSDNQINRIFEQIKQIPFEFSNSVSGEEDKKKKMINQALMIWSYNQVAVKKILF